MNEIEINVSRMPWVPDNDTYLKIREAILCKHEHRNKTALDLISSEKIEGTDCLKIGEKILAFKSDMPFALTTADLSNLFSKSETIGSNRYLDGEGLKNYHEMHVISEIKKMTHIHDNFDVLNKFSDDNGTLTYNNNPIGGSGSTSIKVMSFPQMDGSDIYPGYRNNDIIGFVYSLDEEGNPTEENPFPPNSIILDVGIVLNDDTEIRRNQMWQTSAFGGSVVEICSTPAYDPNYSYPVFRVTDVVKTTIFDHPLYTTLKGEGYKHLNVYYI